MQVMWLVNIMAQSEDNLGDFWTAYAIQVI